MPEIVAVRAGLEAGNLAMSLEVRAREALSRPGSWLDRVGDHWLVRAGSDRRRRPVLRLSEVEVRSLRRDPGLAPRVEGGWRLAGLTPADAPARLATPTLRVDPNGRDVQVTVNRGESPVAWLARRKGPDGRPYLTTVEVAAAEQLREEFERASMGGRVTMNWSATPRDRVARGAGAAPMASLARRRVRRALAEVGPGLREVLEQVCLYGSAIQAAERALGLPSRSGKVRLKLALERLARHYRMI